MAPVYIGEAAELRTTHLRFCHYRNKQWKSQMGVLILFTAVPLCCLELAGESLKIWERWGPSLLGGIDDCTMATSEKGPPLPLTHSHYSQSIILGGALNNNLIVNSYVNHSYMWLTYALTLRLLVKTWNRTGTICNTAARSRTLTICNTENINLPIYH